MVGKLCYRGLCKLCRFCFDKAHKKRDRDPRTTDEQNTKCITDRRVPKAMELEVTVCLNLSHPMHQLPVSLLEWLMHVSPHMLRNAHPVTHATPDCFTTWVTNASASPRTCINTHPLCHLSQATPDCFIAWTSDERASVHVQTSIHPVTHPTHQLTASLPEWLTQAHHPTYKWTPTLYPPSHASADGFTVSNWCNCFISHM